MIIINTSSISYHTLQCSGQVILNLCIVFNSVFFYLMHLELIRYHKASHTPPTFIKNIFSLLSH